MNCIFMYNRSIDKVIIHLLFAMISVEESKNVYQWKNVYQCVYFRVLFVVFLVEMIAQLTCLLGLDYLPTAQAVLVLKVTLTFSFIINVVGAIGGIIATTGNGSFLGTPLPLIIAVDSGITFGLWGISSLSSIAILSANGLIDSFHSFTFIYFIAIAGAFIIIEIVIILLYGCLSKEGDDSPNITNLAFVVTWTGAEIGVVCLILLFSSPYQETSIHEQLYGNIPVLIVLLVHYALKALGTGGLWIFGIFTRSNNREEESKTLLGDTSMSTFRTF
jgi:hypothetical protein